MKPVTALLAMLAVACAAAWVTGQDAPKPGNRPQPKPKFYGEQSKMVELLELSDEQQVKLAELNAARDKEVREIQAKYQALLLNMLTESQKSLWNEHVTMMTVQRLYPKLNFSEEQNAKIKQAVPKLLPDGAPGDDKSRADLVRKVYEFVAKEILTDEQKAALRAQYKQPEKRPPTPAAPQKPADPKNADHAKPDPVQPPDDSTLPPL